MIMTILEVARNHEVSLGPTLPYWSAPSVLYSVLDIRDVANESLQAAM